MKQYCRKILSLALVLCLPPIAQAVHMYRTIPVTQTQPAANVPKLQKGVPVLGSEVAQTPANSYNKNGYDYINASRWTTPIDSYLVWEDGGYTRVEAIDGFLTVERYDEDFQFLSRRDLPLELPIFGGAYLCEDFNFAVDGTDVLTLDHGDAYPRSVVLFRNDFSNGIPDYRYSQETVNVFPIAESTGHYNDTGVAVGGFEYSDTHYLVAGNSASQSGGIDFLGHQRNIFITATLKQDFSQKATTILWITDYEEGAGVSLGTPILKKLRDGRFFLLWRVDRRINCCYITADGQLDGRVFELEGNLSDCMPLQRDGCLIWYVTDGGGPVFYSVDLDAPGQVTVPHTHSYVTETKAPTCTEPGQLIYRCGLCGYSYADCVA